MEWFVYLVECADGTLYCGTTPHLQDRLNKHNAGKGAKYTRTRRPVRLVYSFKCNDHSTALKEEHRLKQLPRQQKLQIISDSAKPAHP